MLFPAALHEPATHHPAERATSPRPKLSSLSLSDIIRPLTILYLRQGKFGKQFSEARMGQARARRSRSECAHATEGSKLAGLLTSSSIIISGSVGGRTAPCLTSMIHAACESARRLQLNRLIEFEPQVTATD